MKYVFLVIIVVLLIVVSTSVSFTDKYAVIGHGFSQEEVTEIRHNIFSGSKKITKEH
tara:strand:+ start:240 stop:410 length:171 start_codon:yes stop_codon:yes gene_type:complete